MVACNYCDAEARTHNVPTFHYKGKKKKKELQGLSIDVGYLMHGKCLDLYLYVVSCKLKRWVCKFCVVCTGPTSTS